MSKTKSKETMQKALAVNTPTSKTLYLRLFS
ncbi:MAG: hypothetical protein RLZZ541_1305, partial [Pseudomonadota bacterium]